MTSKIKIALIAPESLTVPPKDYGGIEAVVYNLAKGLEELGKDVTVICREGSTYGGKKIISGIEGPHGEDGIKNYLHNMGDLSEFDVIHDHMTGATKCKVSSEKILTTLHWNHTGLSAGFYNVNCISHSQRNWLMNEWKREFKQTEGKGKIKDAPVVQHGLDPNEFRMNENVKDYNLYLSKVAKYKGADILVDLVKSMPNENFVVAGSNGDYMGILKEVSNKYNNLKYVGEVSYEEKLELYANAKLFIFPTGGYDQLWKEPFGIVMIEAMMAGIPILSTRNGETPYIVKDGINGFLCDSVNDFVKHINTIEDVDMSKKSIREYGIKNFSNVKMANEYYKLYEKLLEE